MQSRRLVIFLICLVVWVLLATWLYNFFFPSPPPPPEKLTEKQQRTFDESGLGGLAALAFERDATIKLSEKDRHERGYLATLPAQLALPAPDAPGLGQAATIASLLARRGGQPLVDGSGFNAKPIVEPTDAGWLGY